MIYFSFYFIHHIPSGSEVFGSIAFKLFNLGQTFQVALHKLRTISCVHSCVSFLSGITWSHGVHICVLLFVKMNMVPSGVWKLLPRMNRTCGGLQFIFWGLGWFLLIFPGCQAKRHWVWSHALYYSLEIHPQVHLQLTQMMSISLSEASKAMTEFTVIFQAV